MKNATLKDLRFQIIFSLTIILVMFTVFLFELKDSKETISTFIIFPAGILLLDLPLILRYRYVKKVCEKAPLIEGNIVKIHNNIFARAGYYDIKIKNTNTIVTTSSIFKLLRRFEVDDEVVICFDEKYKEAIIVWGPVH